MMVAATGALAEDEEEDGSHILFVLMVAGKRWTHFPEYQARPLTKGKI